MASELENPNRLTGSYTRCLGYQIPIVLGHNSEFLTLCRAFEGRSRSAYNLGIQSSINETRDLFLRLVNHRIPGYTVSVIFSTLSSAIRVYEQSNHITSRDYDLLRKLVNLVHEYNLICDRQWPLLLDEIKVRQRDLVGVETQTRAARQLREREAARKRDEESRAKRIREEEAEFELAAIQAAEQAEKRQKGSPESSSATSAPRQFLFAIAPTVPTANTRSGIPELQQRPSRHTQEIQVSVEELELIRSVRFALDENVKITWPDHKGRPEYDRLGPEAILDLAETVVDGVLPGAVITPSADLPRVFYHNFGGVKRET